MNKKFTRLTAFLLVVVLVFAILISRLVYIQLINGDYYWEIAQAMGEKPKKEIAPRGEILDRNEKKLATNRLGYSIIYTPSRKKTTDDEINKAIIESLNILYKNKDESRVVANSLPINYDKDNSKFSYKTTAQGNFNIAKFARGIKKPNKFQTSFDVNFDYSKLEELDKRLSNSKSEDKPAITEEIESFEKEFLSNFNPEVDAKETLYKFANKYKLIEYDDSGSMVNKYNLSEERLYMAASLRYSFKTAEYRQYEDFEIAKNVTKETAWEFQIKSDGLTGISTQIIPIRYYPYGEVGSAFLGYLGKISNPEKYENLGYDLSRELVGKNYLEYTLENRENNDLGIQLRGEPGIKYVKVDKFGKVIEETASIESVPGDTVVTSINIDMQEAAEKSLDEVMARIRRDATPYFSETYPAYRGAVVAMDINTGEILTLVSRPGFNPNDFAETGRPSDPILLEKYQLTSESLRKAREDRNNLVPLPMFNYATQGAVAPGSTFKPFTAIAGLEEGVITKNTIITDKGIYPIGGGKGIKCWVYDDYGRTHGAINVADALKVSCNYFFNSVGEKLGNDRFSEWARKFGIARDEYNKRPSTGIEISESPGVVGTPEEIKRRAAGTFMSEIVNALENPKYGGYTIEYQTTVYTEIYNMLIDGVYDESKLDELGITNSQARTYIKTRTNRMNTGVVNSTEVLFASMGQGMVALTPLQMAQQLSTIINGGTRYKAHLIKKVLNPDGTVKKEIEPEVLNELNLKPENVNAIIDGMGKVNDELGGTGRSVFGNYPIKTGGKTGTAQSGSSHPDRAAYGWFVSFAPVEKPEIVVVVAIYDGGHGNYAAHTTRAIYDVYFKDRPEMQQYLANKNQGK